jgi:hypothetical protein
VAPDSHGRRASPQKYLERTVQAAKQQQQQQQQQEGEGVERGRLEQASASLGGLAGRRVSPSPTGAIDGGQPPPGPRAAAEGAAGPKVQFDPAAAVARQVRAGAHRLSCS